ncbi:YciI family protein [Roseisolibacter sp. H3M3-2]|uniref:YciI family protein n=1 Tax=Roseisolibacter sp. H3M3-2 TaxID=3031323 RepID=UPI0023DBA508|nr:YciI family protein [Roseisolibacter sp. H3M3-2]MDF1503441.1 YciI family protein [Roseisolibacter sp. H3M3-2]
MKYMLMMHAPRGTAGGQDGGWAVGQWSPDDFRAHIAFMFDVNRELTAAGEWVDGQGLAAPAEATLVRARPDGTPDTDGPFAETKEYLAGYWIVDVDSPARAHAIAARISTAPGPGGAPLRMPIEVRQVMSAPPAPEA